MNNLPSIPAARLVVPGFKDLANLQGELRCDAPTGSRLSQHMLFTWAAANPKWHLKCADVRAAFLKGDPYVGRELYIRTPCPKTGPGIAMPDNCIAKVSQRCFWFG